MLFSAKSIDKNHQIGEKIAFEKATGNRAFYGEGLYFSDRVEVTYTKGEGCVYLLDTDKIEIEQVKEESRYKWYKTEHLEYEVTGIREMTVDEALKAGWDKETVERIKNTREGFKCYLIQPVNVKELTLEEKIEKTLKKAKEEKQSKKEEEKTIEDPWMYL